MLIKPRYESKELVLLRYLNLRMELPAKEVYYYWRLEKGFEGEKKFDAFLENISNDWLVLNDLLFEINNSVFQIDSLIITQDKVYLIDIKNLEGDYISKGDIWNNLSGKETNNPLLQLKRSESLFRRLLQNLRINFKVESTLVFIHPEFYLYEAPLDLPAIFPPQLNRFKTKLQSIQSKLNEKHTKLANKLIELHLNENPYTQVPKYNYENLKKGICCINCRGFSNYSTNKTLVCNQCGTRENIDAAVLRNTAEFELLFPDKKITASIIRDWCSETVSKKTIWRVLSSNYKLMGKCKNAYYVKH
jgi:hypothetical protein